MDVAERVLVAFASGDEWTKEIAEFVEARLTRNGLLSEGVSVLDAPNPAGLDTAVIEWSDP